MRADREEGYAAYIGFCNIGAEAIPNSISSLLGIGSGRSFSNPPTSQSPIGCCYYLYSSLTGLNTSISLQSVTAVAPCHTLDGIMK